MEDEVLDYLEHYGVLGMKWGVIKGPGKISKAGKSTKEIKKAGKQKASDYKISKKAARKNMTAGKKAAQAAKDYLNQPVTKVGINSYKEITKGRDIATKTLKAASNFVVGPYVAKYVTQPLIEGKYK
jgi:Sec-independent protein translocase protein TatA